MDVSMIVSICVLVLFGIAYFILFGLLYKADRNAILGRLEDDLITKNIHDEYVSYLESKEECSFREYHEKILKKKGRVSLCGTILTCVVTCFCVAVLIFAVTVRNSGNQMFFGDTAILVVQTGSMQEANPVNQYLADNNLDNQIEGGSLITITKNLGTPQLYDIYAFKSYDGKTTYVHRIVRIFEEDGVTYYTFRGDSNNGSLSDEMFVTIDRFVGKFTGYENWGLGQVVLYLQSGIGMIAVVVAILVLVGFYFFQDKREKAYALRFNQLSKRAFLWTARWDEFLSEKKKNRLLLKDIKIVEKGDNILTLKSKEGLKVLTKGLVKEESKDSVLVLLDDGMEEKRFTKNEVLLSKKGHLEDGL